MSKKAFIEKRFHNKSLVQIQHANQIITEYRRQGYRLTLRQLYYQFVSRNLITNTEASYQKLGTLISDARLAGLIDWSAIEDRTRNLRSITTFDDARELMQNTSSWFTLDKWHDQPNRIEVWVEKEALLGVLQRVCDQYEVPFFACKGYVSQSEMYDAAKRYIEYIENNQDIYILHLGDHDPSGIDMTRDITDRTGLFLGDYSYASKFGIHRLALNYDQIEQYNPPPNPAKNTDTRFIEYQRQFGDSSWELDALEPAVIAQLIEDNILNLRDESIWEESIQGENHQKEILDKISNNWIDVRSFISRME
jgi:hypothetical protein